MSETKSPNAGPQTYDDAAAAVQHNATGLSQIAHTRM